MYRINDDTELRTTWATPFTLQLAAFSPPNVGVVGPTCRSRESIRLVSDVQVPCPPRDSEYKTRPARAGTPERGGRGEAYPLSHTVSLTYTSTVSLTYTPTILEPRLLVSLTSLSH